MDDFYSEITEKNKYKYQYHFSKIIEEVDTGPHNRWLSGKPEKKDGEYEKAAEKVSKIVDNIEDDIYWLIVYVMFLQYALADVIQRELHKHQWVDTVLNRKGTDFFPHHNSVLQILEKAGLFDE